MENVIKQTIRNIISKGNKENLKIHSTMKNIIMRLILKTVVQDAVYQKQYHYSYATSKKLFNFTSIFHLLVSS